MDFYIKRCTKNKIYWGLIRKKDNQLVLVTANYNQLKKYLSDGDMARYYLDVSSSPDLQLGGSTWKCYYR